MGTYTTNDITETRRFSVARAARDVTANDFVICHFAVKLEIAMTNILRVLKKSQFVADLTQNPSRNPFFKGVTESMAEDKQRLLTNLPSGFLQNSFERFRVLLSPGCLQETSLDCL